MRITPRYRAALTVALATAISAVPLQVATADDTPPAPSIALNIANAIDIYGPATDTTLTVANPPTADTYVSLIVNSGTDELHITDDSGQELPFRNRSENSWFVDIGAADSNNNTIPGGTLAAGEIHLHIGAGYAAHSLEDVQAVLVDGATNKAIAGSRSEFLRVQHPGFTTSWLGPGSQWQSTSPVPLTTGASGPLVVSIQQSMGMTTPPATTTARVIFTPQQLAAAGYTARQVADSLHVAYSPYQETNTFSPRAWTIGADGSVSLDLAATHWDSTNPLRDQFLAFTAVWGLPAGPLTATLENRDLSGRLFSSQPLSFQLTAGPVPATLRWNRFAIDGAGTMWNYEGTGNPGSLFQPRRMISKGWHVYNTVTSLNGQRADGTGDLVGLDATGTLWLHRATGNPSSPLNPARIPISKGWNIYNTIVGVGDVTGDGHPDLAGRDRNGGLWIHKSTGNPAKPFDPNRIPITAGWNIYNMITGVGDITGDGHPDILGRDANGTLWIHKSTGNPAKTLDPNRIRVAGNWSAYTAFAGIRDLTADDHPDLITRDRNGDLWLHQGTGNPAAPFKAPYKMGTGWNSYTIIH
ncbi:FG-GAP repeat domain-containing protein [Streptomyces sp. H39-C1]|uniref:FG-GAP repeat domain-containing protein n=1 Tax=Streptomyces sp. H39-C1 TaxID=3004355 RepID=UPI0022AF9B8A|nr:VCBS repeat-containing protein [Streptomyces sp. H39-C1]MCZ4099803.1 VCBS repeat-containing protein [Streptomyces sp. H39-C1]